MNISIDNYSIINGLPIDVEKCYFTVNLEKYRILVEDDIYVTMKLIETPNEDDDINFSASLFGQVLIIRPNSQAECEKVGTNGVGFNCTLKY